MFERPETREQGKLRKRLRAAVGAKAAKRIDFVKEAEKLSAVKPLDAALGADRADRRRRCSSCSTQADMKLTVGGLLLGVGVPVPGGRGS